MAALYLLPALVLGLASSQGEPDEWTLFRGLASSPVVEVVVGDERLAAGIEDALERSGRVTPHALVLTRPEDSDPTRPRVVVGSLDEPWIQALALRLGYTGAAPDEGEGFLSLDNAVYEQTDDVLTVTRADPDRPGLPMTLHLAAVGGGPALASDLEHVVPRWRRSALVRRGADLVTEFSLNPDGTPDRGRQEIIRRDAGSARTRRSETYGRVDLRILGDVSTDRARRFAWIVERARRRVAGGLGISHEFRQLEVRLVDDQGLVTTNHGRGDLSVVLPSDPSRIYCLMTDSLPHDGGAAGARATALELLGPPSHRWLLDGIGFSFAETYWGWPVAEWISWLHDADLAPSVADLTDVGLDFERSPHLVVPMRGALVSHLIASLGAEPFARIWRGEAELVVDEDLEREFRAHLDSILAVGAERLPLHRERRRAALAEQTWRAGFHLVSDRGDLATAVARGDADLSLERAQVAGASAAAFSPLVFLEPRQDRSAARSLAPWPDADLRDVVLGAAIGEARAAGMSVMLSPLMVATPHGTWADRGAIGGAEEMDVFFDRYARALEHYALLGELVGVDLLCIGSNYVTASGTRFGPEAGELLLTKAAKLQARWVALIAGLRGLTQANLTYAADAGVEFTHVGFWRELDLIGVNFFPSVKRPATPHSRRQARGEMQRLLGTCLYVSTEMERPLLLVQAGFPSNLHAASSPRRSFGSIDLGLQAELFEILGEVVKGPRARGDLAGLFLWSWDPDPAAGGPGDSGHTPQGKPAEAALSAVLSR